MPGKKRDATENGGGPSGSVFTKTVFGFFSSVLKSIAKDDLLRVLWGVEVLLFVILAFMIWFGDITRDQRFGLAIIITASVVGMFVFSAWRSSQGRWSSPPGDQAGRPSTSARASASHPELVEQARTCLQLLTEIHDANARIIRRGGSGAGPWADILRDTYNHVCDTCHRRRFGTEPPDAYFDTICAEPDVSTVCTKKWELGEALDDYRNRLNRVPSPPLDHDGLERLIRRSVTQPSWSPRELDTAIGEPIKVAKRIVRPR
jgi:hypothetical protein